MCAEQIKDDSGGRAHQGIHKHLSAFLALMERVDVSQLLQQIDHCDGYM